MSNTSKLEISHVGKYDRANDWPKLAMLTIDIGDVHELGALREIRSRGLEKGKSAAEPML